MKPIQPKINSESNGIVSCVQKNIDETPNEIGLLEHTQNIQFKNKIVAGQLNLPNEANIFVLL